VTCPTLTPLNSTGEPTDRPVIEPEKNITNGRSLLEDLPDPKTVMPAAANATRADHECSDQRFRACLATPASSPR